MMETISKRCLLLVAIFFVIPLSPAAADLICPFDGQIDFGHKKFNLKLELGEESSVFLEGTSLAKDQYYLLVNVNHLRTSIFDLSTEFETTIGVKNLDRTAQRSFQGQISSRYSLINYKPFRELSGFFEMRDKTLYLESLSLGGVTLNGYIELMSPYRVDFSLILKEIKMADFLAFWGGDEDINSQGLVSGHILVSGFLNQLGLKGSLASYNGFVDQLSFDSIILNLEGIYPVIHLANSTVAQTDGMAFNIEGDFDLTHKERFEEEITALKKLPVVIANRSKSSLEWTISRKETSPDSNTTEFKYFLRKEPPHKGTIDEGTEMLGVERSVKF